MLHGSRRRRGWCDAEYAQYERVVERDELMRDARRDEQHFPFFDADLLAPDE
jgi:hypothetical protein